MPAIQVAISQDFFQAFARVPRAQQKKVNEFVSKFRNNPEASGINYEKINDAASPGYRSVRIDQDYRGIVYKPKVGNVYLMMWVDKHDAAYDWARRHKCEVHPETGSLQIYETVHSELAVAVVAQAVPAAEPLFSLRDRELLRLGIPQERLEGVKALVSQDQLDAMQNTLPVEAFEALCFLAEGLPLEEVMEEYAAADGPSKIDIEDYERALLTSQSQRRFHVVEDEMELKQMLEAPLEQWRVFLHPTQRELVDRTWNGPVRVLGGAGTGKTVVAMHRARWLVKNVLEPDERLLFTTFTRNLAMDIEANLRKICTPEQMKQIEVMNIDRWVHRFLKREKESLKIVYPGNESYDKCWERAVQMAPSEIDLPDSFYEEEWERVILPQRVLSQKEYFKASRIGRGVALNRKQRMQIWPVFEEMRLQLHQHGLVTMEDGVFIAIDKIREGAVVRPYRAVVVDEGQDLGAEAFKLLGELVPIDNRDCMMIVGDAHQRIYKKRASLSSCGINIRGRGRKLRINYRTSEQIRRYATAVLEGVEVDDLDGGTDRPNGYRSLFDGQPPSVHGFENAQDEAEFIVQKIRRLQEEAVPLSDICLVGRTEIPLKMVTGKLREAGIEVYKVSRDTTDNTAVLGVRYANMHRIKGLEFKDVFLVGISEGVVPMPPRGNSTEDITEIRARELNERALLHVAATRAVRSLFVTWCGSPSRFIANE
ncbi:MULTISPECIES: UvrD-helicase domain-containing protein [unclassified Microbulbifer]|uniref:UvrD-helicase domain-containing protein n=1 Tax=unclassified Microbulbifer TaxID=2619833 RepID=UPI0027E4C113|nr:MULTISPECIES: UvrD-helicase domain-containing protein [unclassified Microbulbifer]